MPRLRMKQQFAIGAKNPGAATTVVRLALRWGGTNQSGPVCAQIKVSIRSLFLPSSSTHLLHLAGWWSVTWTWTWT